MTETRPVRKTYRLTSKNDKKVQKRLKANRKVDAKHTENDIINWLIETYLI